MKRAIIALALIVAGAATLSGCAVYEVPPRYGYYAPGPYYAAPPPPPPAVFYGGGGWGWHGYHHWH